MSTKIEVNTKTIISLKNKGILLVSLGAICFSAKAIFIKLAYKTYSVDYMTLLALRFGMALPFFVAIAFFRNKMGHFKFFKSNDWLVISLVSLLGYYIASLFDFMGLQFISAGIERVILFVYPTLVVVFSRLFFKTKISKTALLALAISYLGIFIIAIDPNLSGQKDFVKGAIFVLISAITYALYLVFGGEQIKKHGSINFNTISLICASVYVLLHFRFFSSNSLLNLPLGLYIYGFLLAIVSTVIPTFLMMEGIKILGANLGSIVGSIGPVSTIFLGYFVLHEALSFQEIIGSALVLVGVLLIGKN